MNIFKTPFEKYCCLKIVMSCNLIILIWSKILLEFLLLFVEIGWANNWKKKNREKSLWRRILKFSDYYSLIFFNIFLKDCFHSINCELMRFFFTILKLRLNSTDILKTSKKSKSVKIIKTEFMKTIVLRMKNRIRTWQAYLKLKKN